MAYWIAFTLVVLCACSASYFIFAATVSTALLAYALYEWARPPVLAVGTKASATDRFHEDKVPQDLDYIIIGGGMSGLSAAAVLARCGYRVVVLEQHDRAGGGTHVYDLEGFRFDAGLHYTIPWSGPLLRFAAGSAAPKVEFKKMGEEDGTFDKIVLGEDPPFLIKHHEAHLDALRKMFPAPEDQAAINKYMDISNGLLKSTPIYILSKFLPLWMQKLVWRFFLKHFAKYSGQIAIDVLQSITTNKKLISLLCGLWIDTGARPDKGTFFLMASVFRGLPHEGGAYPCGGSQLMSESLVHAIVANHGRVLVKANVEEIIIEDNRATGVVLRDGPVISARLGVISTAGYDVTFNKLVSEEVCLSNKIDRKLPFGQSAGFVMVNLGIRGTAKELGITNVNTWYHPTDKDYDIIKPLQNFMKDPLHNDMPMMITFPSVKDQDFSKTSDRTTCQLLILGDYSWFEQWREEPCGARSDEYVDYKQYFVNSAKKILFRFYPQLEDRIDFVDVSSPLSIEYYLAAPGGAAVGLEPSPLRYGGDWEIMSKLDSITPVSGLYLSGQDTLICGVIMAQVAGVATAMRLAGFWKSLKFTVRSLLHD